MNHSKINKPIIGISLDREEAGGYNKEMPWYALRTNYCSSISNAGGLPFALPYDTGAIDDYLNIIDGLLLTGGFFDVDPSYYGSGHKHKTVETKNDRTKFEFEIARQAIYRNIPILGICGGQQLMNVALGGTLIQHIPDEIENCLEHEQKFVHTKPAHSVAVIENTLLSRIVGKKDMQVNSSHHQAVKTVGDDVLINAIAPDGVIEGIEYTKHPFCIGVEWHPEYLIDDGDSLLIEAFIRSSKK